MARVVFNNGRLLHSRFKEIGYLGRCPWVLFGYLAGFPCMDPDDRVWGVIHRNRLSFSWMIRIIKVQSGDEWTFGDATRGSSSITLRRETARVPDLAGFNTLNCL